MARTAPYLKIGLDMILAIFEILPYAIGEKRTAFEFRRLCSTGLTPINDGYDLWVSQHESEQLRNPLMGWRKAKAENESRNVDLSEKHMLPLWQKCVKTVCVVSAWVSS
jgi:hypothetical protein